MTRTFRRATRALIAPLAAALLSGCYTAAPFPQTSPSAATARGYASYQTPSGSFRIAVFASPPQSHGNDGFIWYYGNHPRPANHVLGPFCHIQGSHRHDYAPYRSHRYVFHDGHYFWVGDSKPYVASDQSYAYYGHHPYPHYFGGTCRIRGLHRHAYAPITAGYYRLKNGAYFFTGVYDPDYYAERNRYDASGWRLDHRARGYREHERVWREERSAAAADENPTSRLRTGYQISREEPTASDSVEHGAPARTHGRQKASRAVVVPPYGALDAAERMKAQRVTPKQLVERMRERMRRTSGSAPANGADDGNRE